MNRPTRWNSLRNWKVWVPSTSLVCLIAISAFAGERKFANPGTPAAKEEAARKAKLKRGRAAGITPFESRDRRARRSWPRGAVAGPGTYATGFEAGDGFAPGPIEGQAGWTPFFPGDPEAHIDTANPALGAQHVRIDFDPALPREN